MKMKKGMGTWKAKRFEKTRKGSQTPGRLKVASCQADAGKKYHAKRSRSYKSAEYSAWCRMCDKYNKG